VASVRGCEITSARAVAWLSPRQCSHLHVGRLGYRNISDAGARDLAAALQVNTTLTAIV
jgi:hypothetical protein